MGSPESTSAWLPLPRWTPRRPSQLRKWRRGVVGESAAPQLLFLAASTERIFDYWGCPAHFLV
eukprot:9382411-Prorocentrum_lima.AAC.1